jgi:radical SAM-linked protein
MERALRRADIPMAYSKGFSPHAKISFSAPTPLGIPSSAEYMDVHLVKPLSAEIFVQRLNSVLPDDMHVLEAIEMDDDVPGVLGKAAIGCYTIRPYEGVQWISQSHIDMLMGMNDIIMEKRTKKGLKEINIRPCIKELILMQDGQYITAKLLLPSVGGINPDILLKAFDAYTGAGLNIDDVAIHKDDVLLEDGCAIMGNNLHG